MPRCLPLIAALCLAAGLAAGDVYQAPSPEPTDAETLILELINRLRMDPQGETNRIAPENGPADPFIGKGVDVAMFRKEMNEIRPVPPLVFNLQLLDAARKHSHYMILNEMGHDEDPKKAGFTAVDFADRMRAAGFIIGGVAGENCFRNAHDPWHSQVGFTVDGSPPDGPGGMQPGRGHRSNLMNPAFREIGPGVVPHDGKLSITHDLSSRGNVARLVGGVIYVDLDQNNFYDPGEGRGGILVAASDGSKAVTWASGAYTLELKTANAVTLTVEFAGVRQAKPFPAGSDNLKFDWAIPPEVMRAVVDKLLAAVAKEADAKAPNHFRAAVALAMGARGLVLDDERAAKVKAAVGEVGDQLAAAQQAALAALDGDPKTCRKIVADQAKPYRGTAAADWFKEAEMLSGAAQLVADFAKQAQRTPTQARTLTKQLEDARDGAKHGEFRARLEKLLAQARAAGPN